MNPSLRTRDAARYLSERGKKTSSSWLEKARMRGPDDDRDPGPNWSRDSAGICWYSTADLDSYVIRALSARLPRAAAPQPLNFRGGPGAAKKKPQPEAA